MSDKPIAPSPNCYKCKHRRGLAGSGHSRCAHPVNEDGEKDPFSEMMATFASVGRTGPVIGDGAIELGIKANAHGVMRGWFNWPFNFDPTWLEACNGFESNDN